MLIREISGVRTEGVRVQLGVIFELRVIGKEPTSCVRS